jgi:hypothetical protein
MKSYVRQIVAKLGGTGVLTHLLPYEVRVQGRQS